MGGLMGSRLCCVEAAGLGWHRIAECSCDDESI
jgi:hypothetical protein